MGRIVRRGGRRDLYGTVGCVVWMSPSLRIRNALSG